LPLPILKLLRGRRHRTLSLGLRMLSQRWRSRGMSKWRKQMRHRHQPLNRGMAVGRRCLALGWGI
jgi:urease accessory protein UreF